MDTVLVLGDQLSTTSSAMLGRSPGDCRVLMVEADNKIRSARWHRQRLHMILSAMRKFARSLSAAGYEVDYRKAPSMRSGLDAHRREFTPARVQAMAPANRRGLDLLRSLDVELIENNQFLCSAEQFEAWAQAHLDGGGKRLTMETFYRWQRTRLDLLIDDDGRPTGGAWNYDKLNREPPPKGDHRWPEVTIFDRDEIDAEVAEEIESHNVWGEADSGWWPTTAAEAQLRLRDFLHGSLADFGPYQDAMMTGQWSLSHSLISPAINLGLLDPLDAAEAAIAAYEAGDAPLNSVEGFVRQIIGWREYVSGLYWLWGPEYATRNGLSAHREVPQALTDGTTNMRCVSEVVSNLSDHGWNHHIERLMVIGNLALLTGVDPAQLVEWMSRSYVDAADWVMVPNVVGMALHADDGAMATKPYAAGGAYINRMSDYCSGCVYNPKKRTGEDACPFTTLYWDFLARNEDALRHNSRLGNQMGAMRKLKDLAATRERAVVVLQRLDSGTL